MLLRLAIFYRELVRRNVFRVGAIYVIGSWVLIEVANMLLPSLGYPEAVVTRVVFIVVVAGLPLAVLLAWFFQFSRRGIIRTVPFSERRQRARRLQKITVQYENRKGERRAEHALSRIANVHTLRESGLLESPPWLLRALDDTIAGQTYTFRNKITLGRDQGCDITLPGTRISRRHAELQVDGEEVCVRDLDTPNGTFINDARTEGEARAGHGDTIRLAGMRFELVAPNVDMLETVIFEKLP